MSMRPADPSPFEEPGDCVTGGDLLRLRFNSISVEGDSAEVSINNTWVKAKGSDVIFLSGGGCQLTLHRIKGSWSIDAEHMCWIS